jgi:hypothetical protein
MYANQYLRETIPEERKRIIREASGYLYRVSRGDELAQLSLMYVRMVHPDNKIKPRNTDGEILPDKDLRYER